MAHLSTQDLLAKVGLALGLVTKSLVCMVETYMLLAVKTIREGDRL